MCGLILLCSARMLDRQCAEQSQLAVPDVLALLPELRLCGPRIPEGDSGQCFPGLSFLVTPVRSPGCGPFPHKSCPCCVASRVLFGMVLLAAPHAPGIEQLGPGGSPD